MKPQLSFEFYPPQTRKGRANLLAVAARLSKYRPLFHSVTYGAGGSTRRHTFAAVAGLREAGLEVAPHLSWGSDDAAQVLELLASYRRLGVSRLVALRGDAPSGIGPTQRIRHAEELVRLVRAEAAAELAVFVAAYPEVHPEAPSAAADIDYLKRKVDAGADGCITQYFYNADGYFYFRDRCAAAGIDVPVVAGVMPILNYASLRRFSDKAGAEIPRWMRMRLDGLVDDAAGMRAFCDEAVAALCSRLLRGGAPGLHFYTLNKAAPSEAALANVDGV